MFSKPSEAKIFSFYCFLLLAFPYLYSFPSLSFGWSSNTSPNTQYFFYLFSASSFSLLILILLSLNPLLSWFSKTGHQTDHTISFCFLVPSFSFSALYLLSLSTPRLTNLSKHFTLQTIPDTQEVVVRGHNATLLLEDVTYEHQGEYQCVATSHLHGKEVEDRSNGIMVEVVGKYPLKLTVFYELRWAVYHFLLGAGFFLWCFYVLIMISNVVWMIWCIHKILVLFSRFYSHFSRIIAFGVFFA